MDVGVVFRGDDVTPYSIPVRNISLYIASTPFLPAAVIAALIGMIVLLPQ